MDNLRGKNSFFLLVVSLVFIVNTQITIGQTEFRLEEVETPSPNFKELSYPLFKLKIPENWNQHPWGNFTAFTPSGAYFEGENQSHMSHGIYFGIVPPKGNLANTLGSIISADFEANPHLQERSSYQTVVISGSNGLVSNSSGDYGFTGLREIVVYYAVYLPNGNVFHIATDCPEINYSEYQPIFNEIIESIEFTSNSKKTASGATQKAKSVTGYVDVVEVNNLSCRLRIISGERVYTGTISFSRLSLLIKKKITSYAEAVKALNGQQVQFILPGTGNNSALDFNKIVNLKVLVSNKSAQPESDWSEKSTDTETIINLSTDILFDFDKASVKPEAIPVLIKLARFIRENKPYTIQLNGFTDSIGSDEYNFALSERRANSVKQWLVAKGSVESQRIKTQGFGESQPIAPNTTAEGLDYPPGRQKNRRVEIRIPRN
jgi:outer membrane protein OmpA-like peptidoglycan-associated protein